jgi:excisionase family DNA binding protein
VRDVARLLNVSEQTVYRWARKGSLPAHRVHDQYLFNRVEPGRRRLSDCRRAEAVHGLSGPCPPVALDCFVGSAPRYLTVASARFVPQRSASACICSPYFWVASRRCPFLPPSMRPRSRRSPSRDRRDRAGGAGVRAGSTAVSTPGFVQKRAAVVALRQLRRLPGASPRGSGNGQRRAQAAKCLLSVPRTQHGRWGLERRSHPRISLDLRAASPITMTAAISGLALRNAMASPAVLATRCERGQDRGPAAASLCERLGRFCLERSAILFFPAAVRCKSSTVVVRGAAL